MPYPTTTGSAQGDDNNSHTHRVSCEDHVAGHHGLRLRGDDEASGGVVRHDRRLHVLRSRQHAVLLDVVELDDAAKVLDTQRGTTLTTVLG